MSTKASVLTLASVLALACSQEPPPKAPGSDPADMTPEGHAQAAESDQQESEAHAKEADNASENYAERVEGPGHEREAEKHKAFSEQHKAAGEKAAEPASAPAPK